MKRTTTFTAAWRGVAWFGALLLVVVAATGCGGEPAQVAAQPTEPLAPTVAPTDSPVPTVAPTEPPTATQAPTEPPPEPTDTPVPTDTPEPTATATPVVLDDSACIGCHTDEETLKLVAAEDEETEPLSEGEG